MGRYTEFTAKWLDQRYRRTDDDGIYHAHQPIYGRGVPEHCEPHHLFRLARQFQILSVLDGFSFETFLDVGGSEGYGAHLVSTLFGAEVTITDLSTEACKRAADCFAVSGIAADGLHLPFADDSFDVVLCTEVLEHVEHPVECLLELARVARRAVIVTSEEITTDRQRCLDHRPPLLPHIERNLFHVDDFAAVFGPESVRVIAQQKVPAPSDVVPDEQAKTWIRETFADPEPVAHVGCLIALVKDATAVREPEVGEEAILTEVLAPAVPLNPLVRRSVALPDGLVARLRCIETGESLTRDGDRLVTSSGSRSWPIDEEVPRLFTRRDPRTAEVRERLLDLHGGDEARVQAALEVRERLETPVPPPRLAWNFSEQGAREEWLAGPFTRLGDAEDALEVIAEGGAPLLIGPPVRYPRAGIEGFTVSIEALEVSAGAGEGRIWWIGPTDAGFDPLRSLPFTLPEPGAGVLSLTVPLDGHPNDEEDEHDYVFRIDPLSGDGRVRLHALGVLPR